MIDSANEVRRICGMGLPLLKVGQRSKVPIEPWRNDDHFGRKPGDFTDCNIGVKCGVALPGADRSLYVVDIDPRNGGFDGWKYLAEENDFTEAPETFKVQTGSDGWHFYFYGPPGLGKCKLGAGVDFQGVGSYVVGPGSIHPNGKSYFIEDDSPIDELPAALLKVIREKEKAGQFFDGSTGHFSEAESYNKGERDDRLTQVAGALRRAGLSFDAIYSALLKTNQEKCKPPLSDSEVNRIAKSVSRYEPDQAPADSFPEKAPAEPKDDIKPVVGPVGEKLLADLAKIPQMAQGMVKEIGETICAHSHRHYPHIGTAAALSIISAIAQGAYRCPSLSPDGKPGGSLSLLSWITGPSASGKDAYLRAVDFYVSEVCESMVFDKYGSNYGLRCSLFCSNAGISVIDEFQDELAKLNNPGATYLRQILTDMKELTNDLDVMRAVKLGKMRYPAIYNPRFSVYATGTYAGFIEQLKGDMISGGLLSRFMVWPITDVPDRVFNSRLDHLPKKQFDFLRQLYKDGVTDEGELQDIVTEQERFFSTDDNEHRPQFDPTRYSMGIEPDAKLMLIDFYNSQGKKYQNYLAQNLASTDISPGSIADRAPRIAEKIASNHALGCQRRVVTDVDTNFGIFTARTVSDWLCLQVKSEAGSDSYSRLMAKVAAIAEANPGLALTKTDFHKRTGRNYKAKELHEAIESLVIAGDLEALDREGIARHIEGNLPKNGFKFRKGKA